MNIQPLSSIIGKAVRDIEDFQQRIADIRQRIARDHGDSAGCVLEEMLKNRAIEREARERISALMTAADLPGGDVD